MREPVLLRHGKYHLPVPMSRVIAIVSSMSLTLAVTRKPLANVRWGALQVGRSLPNRARKLLLGASKYGPCNGFSDFAKDPHSWVLQGA